MMAAFDRRRKLLHAGLNQIPGVTCLLAQGAFYLFPNVAKFGLSSQDFCARLLEKEKVAAVPGSAFGAEGYLRLSYATSDETIVKGLERLAASAPRSSPERRLLPTPRSMIRDDPTQRLRLCKCAG